MERECACTAGNQRFALAFENAASENRRQQLEDPVESRLEAAKLICRKSGEEALKYFKNIGSLVVESKGPQDRVSQADRNVETLMRDMIADSFPDDGIIGEEHKASDGTSGFTWIIDPIDGTNNFVAGIPVWTTVLACVNETQTLVGIIHDPNMNEMFYCSSGGGAFLNGEAIKASKAVSLSEGILGMGFSRRCHPGDTAGLIETVLKQDGTITKNGSGALSLAYAASGRFVGFLEIYMNAWDCLAGVLLTEEAGGSVVDFNFRSMLESGGSVAVGSPGLIDEIAVMMRRANAAH